jgi:hypothetical protein
MDNAKVIAPYIFLYFTTFYNSLESQPRVNAWKFPFILGAFPFFALRAKNAPRRKPGFPLQFLTKRAPAPFLLRDFRFNPLRG